MHILLCSSFFIFNLTDSTLKLKKKEIVQSTCIYWRFWDNCLKHSRKYTLCILKHQDLIVSKYIPGLSSNWFLKRKRKISYILKNCEMLMFNKDLIKKVKMWANKGSDAISMLSVSFPRDQTLSEKGSTPQDQIHPF